ncbi:DUF1993 domain-containing protein [Erythrobacter sp.]|jgi:hypothetical protein|uniref:DUF1993 domain-containing protein n=1 Tax=Erythrobacter sp. TaxID=1042 RepID=UPI002EB14A54|nr:DUF1993 domain-containing protein [Erythrobacter sp.]
MNLYDQSIATYRSRLDTMRGLLNKAAAHPKGDRLLTARLADDMHPLSTQVRFVGNLPGEALPRLTQRSFTSLEAEDEPATIAGAAAHIERTADLLDGVKAGELKAADDEVVLALPNNMEFTMTAAQYVREWSLPNFYFHLVTAYAILRSEGLDIGKVDFMGHMMRYMTKGPA